MLFRKPLRQDDENDKTEFEEVEVERKPAHSRIRSKIKWKEGLQPGEVGNKSLTVARSEPKSTTSPSADSATSSTSTTTSSSSFTTFYGFPKVGTTTQPISKQDVTAESSFMLKPDATLESSKMMKPQISLQVNLVKQD